VVTDDGVAVLCCVALFGVVLCRCIVSLRYAILCCFALLCSALCCLCWVGFVGLGLPRWVVLVVLVVFVGVRASSFLFSSCGLRGDHLTSPRAAFLLHCLVVRLLLPHPTNSFPLPLPCSFVALSAMIGAACCG